MHEPRQPRLIGRMLMMGFVLILGRVIGGFFVGCRFMLFLLFVIWVIIFVICSPIDGPAMALTCVSRLRRSRFIFGRHPIIMVFFVFGVCFMAFIMRFSVGPFTAQVLKIMMSASCSVVIWCPFVVRMPVMVSVSAVFAVQP